MRKLFLTVGIFGISLFFSCKKPKCFAPYYYLFTITNSAGDTYFEKETSIKMYYMDNNVKVYIEDVSLIDKRFQQDYYADYPYVYSTWQAPIASANKKIKDFYLELPSNDIDTLYLDFKSNECGAAFIEDKFNGSTPEFNKGVHVLKK